MRNAGELGWNPKRATNSIGGELYFTWNPLGSKTVPSGNVNGVGPKFTVVVIPLAKAVCCTLRSGVRKR